MKINTDWTFETVGSGSGLQERLLNIAVDWLGNAFGTDWSGTKLYSVDLMTGESSYVGLLPAGFDNLAFHPGNNPTLYGIGSEYPSPLVTIDVTGATVSTSEIKDTNARFSWGGSICPL